MKNAIVLALMLCLTLGATARAELVGCVPEYTGPAVVEVTENPFDGSGSFMVICHFNTTEPGVILSSSRDDTPDNHAMYVGVNDGGGITADNFYIAATNADVVADDGEDHCLIYGFDVEEDRHEIWFDGFFETEASYNPAIPNIEEDEVQIGTTNNTTFPGEYGIGDFVGEIWDLQIYNHYDWPGDDLSFEMCEWVCGGAAGPTNKVSGQDPKGENVDPCSVVMTWEFGNWFQDPNFIDPNYDFHLYWATGPNEAVATEAVHAKQEGAADYDILPGWDPGLIEDLFRFELGDLDFEQTICYKIDVTEPNYIDANAAGQDEPPGIDLYGHILHPGDVVCFTTWPCAVIIDPQPESPVVVVEGESAEFEVDAWGNMAEDATYTWYKQGGGEVGSGKILTIDPVLLSDEGKYYCTVDNGECPIDSDSGRLLTYRLMAHYKFDNDATDATGAFDGVEVAAPVYIEGNCLEDDPAAISLSGDPCEAIIEGEYTGQYVVVDHEIGPFPKFTVSLWIAPEEQISEDGGRFFNDPQDDEGTVLLVLEGENLVADWIGVGSFEGIEVPMEEWTHVVLTGDNETGECTLYVNGELAGETEDPEPTDLMAQLGSNEVGPLTIGAWVLGEWGLEEDEEPGRIGHYFTGAINDVRIYNFALDPVQVASLYVVCSGESACFGEVDLDFNGDCVVNLLDYAIMANDYLIDNTIPTAVSDDPG